MTLEEFIEHAETHARENDLDGTISLRHLQRLITGQRTTVRPATARLLEALLDRPIGELLARPTTEYNEEDSRLGRVLAAGHALDDGVIDALRLQLTAIRVLDRQLGANVVRDEVDHKIVQVEDLTHAVALPEHRRALLRLLCELQTLAGWLALDQLDLLSSWRHHNRAFVAAKEAESTPHVAHALAQQAVVIAESGCVSVATTQARTALHYAPFGSGRMRAWLVATYGELLSLDRRRAESERAFNHAAASVSDAPDDDEPYLGLDDRHLVRWRSQATAKNSGPEPLIRALELHDPAFRRGGVLLRISLAKRLALTDRTAAQNEFNRAEEACKIIDSRRLHRQLLTARTEAGFQP